MKKKLIGILLGVLVLGFLMSHRLEPELRVYPLAMGFDLNENGYQVYYDMPDLSVYTGDGKPMEASERVWKFSGNSNQEIRSEMERGKKETPDMGHVQVILLGSNLLGNTEKYAEVLESFVSEPMLGSGSYVFVCEDMENVMEFGASKTDSLGEYLVELMDKLPAKKPVILQDLYNAYYNQEPIPVLMQVSAEGEGLMVNGSDNL